MKKILMMTMIAITSAVIAGAKAECTVEVNHKNAIYKCGEKAEFTISIIGKDGNLATNGFADITLDNYGKKVFLSKKVDLAKGNPFKVDGTLKTPGFLRATISGNGFKVCTFGVGFDPEEIRPGAPNPDDFDEFWANAVKKLDETVPEDVKMELIPEKSKGLCNCYRISFASYGSRRVYGWLSMPKDKSRKYPVKLHVPGAGIGATSCPTPPNAIFLIMNVHSYQQPETNDKDRRALYDEQDRIYAFPNGVKRYCQAGIHKSREDYFYYASILGINRAVNWLAKRPECDMTAFTYFGTSQGGGFGLYLCGLNKHITKACIFVPAITDLAGELVDNRQSGWPRIIEAQAEENREAAMKHIPYFDAANFARRVTIPVRFIVGFADNTCSPSAVYAGYNVVPSKDKKIYHGIGMGHAVRASLSGPLYKWQMEK
ncbi:MAG: acetylxylan esterase [Kiritimatiellae bacterium]|nr:acetylxylan esterase [Kiritimatiellia bacterium]